MNKRSKEYKKGYNAGYQAGKRACVFGEEWIRREHKQIIDEAYRLLVKPKHVKEVILEDEDFYYVLKIIKICVDEDGTRVIVQK